MNRKKYGKLVNNMKKVSKKLVRDYIPDIISKSGKISHVRVLNDDEYVFELKKKLCEESEEVLQANSKEKIIEELADVLEVIEAIKNFYIISDERIESVKNKKAINNGKFEDRVYLEYVAEVEE